MHVFFNKYLTLDSIGHKFIHRCTCLTFDIIVINTAIIGNAAIEHSQLANVMFFSDNISILNVDQNKFM